MRSTRSGRHHRTLRVHAWETAGFRTPALVVRGHKLTVSAVFRGNDFGNCEFLRALGVSRRCLRPAFGSYRPRLLPSRSISASRGAPEDLSRRRTEAHPGLFSPGASVSPCRYGTYFFLRLWPDIAPDRQSGGARPCWWHEQARGKLRGSAQSVQRLPAKRLAGPSHG
jgi:hypothetical protein